MTNYSEQIIELIRSNLNLEIDNSVTDIENEPLLGRKFGLQPYDLAYLLFEVEKTFGITFPEKYIIDRGLRTIGGFSRFIIDSREQSEL